MFIKLENGLGAVYLLANKTDKIFECRITFNAARLPETQIYLHKERGTTNKVKIKIYF